MEFLIIIWLLFGIASGVVMNNKGRSGCAGFALGFLLGPFGLIIALVMKADNNAQEREVLQSGASKKCPFCAEVIRAEAIKCRHCGTALHKPMDADLASQLQFSISELDCYGDKQLAALESVISRNHAASQADACASICKKIGRPPFEGPPEKFLIAYYKQLKTRLGEGGL
jgi:hypothetical protein